MACNNNRKDTDEAEQIFCCVWYVGNEMEATAFQVKIDSSATTQQQARKGWQGSAMSLECSGPSALLNVKSCAKIDRNAAGAFVEINC